MKTNRKFFIFGIIIFLNGCAMIPGYKRSALPVPAEFPSGEAYSKSQISQNASSISNLKWQDIFLDTKLQKIIVMALENNRDLQIAVANVERARGLYGIKAGDLYPALTASADKTEQRVPADLSLTGESAVSKQYNVDLGIVAWEVDLFGRIRSLKEKALQEYLATEQARRAVETSLISEVASAYLTLAADSENFELSKATLEAQRSVYVMVWHQYDKGIATEADLRRSQTQVDTAKRNTILYKQMVAQDTNALSLLVGAPVPQDLLPRDLSNISPLNDIALDLSSEVLLRRPDIMAAENQLKAAHAFIGAARAAFFPQISLTSVIGTASKDLSGLFVAGSKAWTFAPSAAMPIFDTRIFAAYKVSKADRKIALAQYEKTIQTAFREVADALAVRATVDQEVAAQESIVNSAKKIFELSEQRYEQGIDGYLSVLDAQRSLYSAQQAFTYLRLRKLLNQVKFYAVLGGDAEPGISGK